GVRTHTSPVVPGDSVRPSGAVAGPGTEAPTRRSAPHGGPISPSSGAVPGADPASQLAVSVRPYTLETAAVRVHAPMSLHIAADSGADPQKTRRSVPARGARVA